MITVLLVDDQALVRTGFRLILDETEDIDVVGEAPDGRHAIQRAEELQPDIILMDVRMPVMDGIAATAQIRTQEQPPKVIILTSFDLDEYVDAALRAGASGFSSTTHSPTKSLPPSVRSPAETPSSPLRQPSDGSNVTLPRHAG